MLDHIILTVSDVERSLKFYTAALKPLKIKMLLPYKGADGHPDLWGFGDGQKAFFWLKQGKPDPASIHWGFVAENNKAVDAFYKAAIAAAAKDKYLVMRFSYVVLSRERPLTDRRCSAPFLPLDECKY